MSDGQGETVLTGTPEGAEPAAEGQEPTNEQNSPAGDKPADDVVADKAGAADTPDDKAEGDGSDGEKAPIEYADFDIPEGVTVADADVEAFKGVSNELGLSQDQAQKLLTFEAERVRQMENQQSEMHTTQVQKWADDAETDAEYGGDAFKENVATAVKAIDTFGTPEVKELIEQTGLGSHPEIIRMFWKIGKATASDGVITGGSNAPPSADAKSMFPNSNHA